MGQRGISCNSKRAWDSNGFALTCQCCREEAVPPGARKIDHALGLPRAPSSSRNVQVVTRAGHARSSSTASCTAATRSGSRPPSPRATRHRRVPPAAWRGPENLRSRRTQNQARTHPTADRFRLIVVDSATVKPVPARLPGAAHGNTVWPSRISLKQVSTIAEIRSNRCRHPPSPASSTATCTQRGRCYSRTGVPRTIDGSAVARNTSVRTSPDSLRSFPI